MKRTVLFGLFGMTGSIFGLILPAAAQQKTVEQPVQGYFNEVGKVEPTDERLARLKLPSGFRLNVFAELENPRWFAVADDGTIYVTQRQPGNLTMLKDTDGDGIADVQRVVVENKKYINGVTIHENKVYFVTDKQVYRADRNSDGTLGEPQMLISDLPDAGQHPNRTLAFGPDGMMYISVGSATNAAVEPNKEAATMLRAQPDGTRRTIFASGLRNTIGFGWHPTSKRLFGMDHGIDWLGNDSQQEELNEIKENAKYGWPFVYERSKIYPHLQVPPEFGLTKEDWAKQSVEPLLMYRAHSAPLQMAYYTGSQFPAEYRNDAFVAMRGSWNRKPASGYEIVRVHFNSSGNPESITPFLTGFLMPKAQDGKDVHFGRPVGVAMLPDGSMLFGDDTNNTLYRVRYEPSGQEMRRDMLLKQEISSKILKSQNTITVMSTTFANDGKIPDTNSAYGANKSPRISWGSVPAGTKSFVLMMEDPDALSPKPFVHWLVANIPANARELPEALPTTEKVMVPAGEGTVQGGHSGGKIGYFGPRPPREDPPHRYHFQIFALDTTLNLPSGFNRHALLKAMQGHVLGSGMIVGTFDR
jgi:Raf kinase inhibitor-like YbhB/YbcL family protein